MAVVSDTSPRLVKRVLGGNPDAAFVALPTATLSLSVTELDRLPMVVALPTTHRLARRARVRLADLGEEPMFWFERARQPAFYDHAQKVFSRHRFTPSILREPEDHHVLLAAVAAGSGLALLPHSFTALKRRGVAYRRLEEGEELAVGVGVAVPKEHQALGELLCRVAMGTSAAG